MDANGRAPNSLGGFDVLGTWWRFDRYVVEAGALRPAPGASLQLFDPWASYAQARSGWGSSAGKAPYESLLDLVWDIRLRPKPKGEAPELTLECEQALLDWCAAHGLLGLLPHEAEVAHLAPRWAPMEEFELAGIPLVVTRLMYQWGYTGWQVGMDVWWQTMSQALDEAPKQEGELVPRNLQPDYWGLPSVLSRAIGDASWATLPIELAWGRFFPDIAEKDRRDHFYPVPLSDVFWQDYAEPVVAFLDAATLFYQTLMNLGFEVRGNELPGEAEHRKGEAHRALFSLLAGCMPALAHDPQGAPIRAFHSKSLLASFAMMAYLDLTSGKRIMLCDEDLRPYVSGAYQARYCSDRCRNRALKRAYRERHREPDPATAADASQGDIQRTSA